MTGTRHHVCTAETLTEHGSRVIASVGGIEVAVFNVSGEYYAIPNHCPHVGAPLGEGSLTGRTTVDSSQTIHYQEREQIVQCPWHCWRFDVTTGTNVDDSQYRIPTFDVEESDGELYVHL